MDFKAGGVIAVRGKGLVSNGIQIGSLALPNVGPLGKWGLSGVSHVGILAPVFDELLVYESTTFPRPPCVRTGRTDAKGVQAHFVSDVIDAGGDVWYYPPRRDLYPHEELRLLDFLESCLGKPYDWLDVAKSGGGIVSYLASKWLGQGDTSQMFCSELVAAALSSVGIMPTKHADAWNPTRLVRRGLATGVLGSGRLIS